MSTSRKENVREGTSEDFSRHLLSGENLGLIERIGQKMDVLEFLNKIMEYFIVKQNQIRPQQNGYGKRVFETSERYIN